MKYNRKFDSYVIFLPISTYEFGRLDYFHYLCSKQIPPDEPIGIPSDQPQRWMMLGIAMAIQENGLIKREQSELAHSAEREDRRAKLNGTDSLDYFAMLRGWGLAREGI